MKKVLDLLSQWAVLISGTFFFVGIIRAILYYLPFHIPVHTYIEFGEVFTIWFPDTLYSVIAPSLFSVFVVMIYYLNPARRLEFYYYHFAIYLMHFLAILYLVFDLLLNWFGQHSPEKMDFIRPYWMLISLVALIGIPFLIGGLGRLIAHLRSDDTSRRSDKRRFDAITNLSFVMLYLFFYFIYEPLAVEISSPHASERIELVRSEQDKVATDDNLRYLGKTRNYIFLWNKITKAAVVYKADQFNEIRIEWRR